MRSLCLVLNLFMKHEKHHLRIFFQIPDNEFSEAKTIFVDGTFLEIVDTTKIGRVFELDLLQ